MVEAGDPVGLPHPPALSAPVEQRHGPQTVLKSLGEAADPESVAGEHVASPAFRRLVATAARHRDGEARAAHGLVMVAEIAVGVGEPEMVAARERRIGQPLHALAMPQEQLQLLGEAGEGQEGVGELEDQLQDPAVPPFLRQPLGQLQRLAERLRGLGVCVAARRFPGEQAQIFDRLLRRVGPRRVVGQAVICILETVRVECL